MPEERKLVTVLFADIAGSTALGEALDPEDLRALMARYYGHARRIIVEHGGTLEKFIGDATMAVFGLPRAHGDDPERALAAALALRTAVAADPALAERFALHLGVNTGDVVAAGDPDGADALVTGDAVNTAARIYDAAAPGEILAGERTQLAAAAGYVFGERRLIQAKNKREPVPVYPLLGPRPVRAVGRPPFVGRRRELAQMALLREAVVEEERPQLVSLVASAGTGKTRLLEEFLAGMDPAEGFQVSVARCPPYGQTLTYWPLRGLLEGLLGGEVARERVADAFLTARYAADDADRLAGHILATLGVEGISGEDVGQELADRESTFNAWRLLVEALARRAPRIIVFEDLHWASESLLDLVEHLMHPHTQATLLMVALARPELLDRRPDWGGGRRNFTSLALEPLSSAQTNDLVGRLAAELPEAARQRIAERSGGNPFFAIELTRALTDRDARGTAPLPDTVHETVLARLDQLPAAERAVLQAAAVAGRAFRAPTVAAALAKTHPAAIHAALDGLLARDLIAPAEGGAFTFRHILFRDVAYGTLARGERVRMHAAVGRWLEDFAADRLDEFAELIAYHYHEAVSLARQAAVPTEPPIDPARAVHFLERAGELSGRSGGILAAQAHLERAIALAPPSEHGRLYEKLGDSVGIYPAWAPYSAALRAWREEGAVDPLVGARLMRKLLFVSLRVGGLKPQPSAEELDALRAEAGLLAEAAGDEDERWRVRVACHFAPAWDDKPVAPEMAAAGTALASAAADYFEARRDWASFSMVLDTLSNPLLLLGDHREVIVVAQRRLGAPGLPASERGDAVAMVASGCLYLGEYARCRATVAQALAALRPGESPEPLAFAVSKAAVAAGLTGHWDEVAALAARVADAPAFLTQDTHWATLIVAMARDDRPAADAAAARLEPEITAASQAPMRGLLKALLRDDPAELAPGSARHGPDSAIILQFLGERNLRGSDTLLGAVRTWAETENVMWGRFVLRVAEALAAGDDDLLAAAIEDAEAGGLIPHSARMRIVLAQRTGDRAHLARARPVLERLGDRQFLRRLEEVESALARQRPATPARSTPAPSPTPRAPRRRARGG